MYTDDKESNRQVVKISIRNTVEEIAKNAVRDMISEVLKKAEITSIAFRLTDEVKKRFNYVAGINKSLTKVTTIYINYDGCLVNAVDTLADLLTEYFSISAEEKMTIFTVVTINNFSFTLG